jgi:2-(1,2-epoxy-1,2-dihydrophenyl)acetyl-CoA isomerase
MTAVLVERPLPGVAVITLNHPETLNAFSIEMLSEFGHALEAVATNREIACCVLTGAGRGFSSGGNIGNMGAASTEQRPIEFYQSAVAMLRSNQDRTVKRLYELDKPTIALVNGPAAGVGMALACACDFRFASEAAFFTTAFARIGRSGDFALPWFLSRVVGGPTARELCFTSRRVTASEALSMGLVSRVCRDGELLDQGLEYARKLAEGPPAAIARMKQAFRLDEMVSLERVLEFEAWSMPLADQSEEGDRFLSAFLERKERPAPPHAN